MVQDVTELIRLNTYSKVPSNAHLPHRLRAGITDCLNNSLNSSKPELQVPLDHAPWSSIAERRENVVYGVLHVEPGEEGIWTDIEGSAEAMSAYEVDVKKRCGYSGYKGRDSRDFSHCKNQCPISIGHDRGTLMMGGKAVPLDAGRKRDGKRLGEVYF